MSGQAANGPAPPAFARPAATLVLIRPRASSGIEVLLLERSRHADFAAGLFVFPGGGVEAEDAGPQARRLTPGLSPESAQRLLPDTDSPNQALAHFVAAIRETFEEAGILLARSADGAPAQLPERQLSEGRQACAAGPAAFFAWIGRQGLALAAEDLIYFAHWITPKAAPKRFDARFFLAEAPAGARVLTDQAEIVAFRWVPPDEALSAHAAGRMAMIEPTFYNLQELRGCASPAQARAALAGRAVHAVLPQFATLPDGRSKVVLPWDPAYVPDAGPT